MPEVCELTDQFQLSSDYLNESLSESMDFQVGPVDTQNPGFASLLTALQQAQAGQLPEGVLESYHTALSAHIEEVRLRMEEIPVPEGFEQQAEQAFAATYLILDQMQGTLDLVAEYLASGDPSLLEEAVATLGGVHNQMREAVQQIHHPSGGS